MNGRRQNKTVNFTVEGETERLYLEWLEAKINENRDTGPVAKFRCIVCKYPRKASRSFVMPCGETEWCHIVDYDNKDEDFRNVLQEMAEVRKTYRKRIKYVLGYCNISFELWMILHKMDFAKTCNDCHAYLRALNLAYDKNYERLGQFKGDVSGCLDQLSLDNVKEAIRRANGIMADKERSDARMTKVCGYSYCQDNPALSVHMIVEKLLNEFGLM